ncbi:MAG: hypothetical protein K2Z81_07995 [Cyanobacteria bacterium]|nr:hypothetical protein [Cyanobacteriota bacterium]
MKVPRAAGNRDNAPSLKTPATAGVYFSSGNLQGATADGEAVIHTAFAASG